MLQQKPLFSIREVAELLKIDRQTVARYIKRGQIKAIKLPSGLIRIPSSEIEYLLTGSDQKGAK